MDDITNKQLELNSLIEFSQLINTNLNLEFILGNILLSIMGKMMITKGAILIKCDMPECDDKTFEIKAIKGINLNLVGTKTSYNIPKEPIFEIESVKENHFFRDNKLNYFFKIYFIDKLLGVLCLGEKLTKEKIKKSELLFIETMLNLSSPTIENSIRFEEIKLLNKNMSAQIQHLRTLFELSKEFNTNFQDRERILKLLKYSLLGNFGIKDYVLLTKTKTENFKVIESGKEFSIDEQLLKNFDEIEDAEIIDESSDNKLRKRLYETGYRLMIPVKSNNNVETIVLLGEKLNKSSFTIGDIQFLESLINLSVISLDNTVLFNEFLVKQKIESELEVAREIQLALLPKEVPAIKGFTAAGCNIPALHVGGDYYDIIKLTEDKYAFVIADVSGKGTPASLLMSNIQSAVHSFLKFYNKDFDLINATQKINELIFSNTSSEKFITFFWGILDTENNEFEYVNAGHNPPFLFKENEVINLDNGGLMLGVIESGIGYNSGKVVLEDKDIIVMYTDGVSEARNNINEEYSEARLIRVINECRKDNSESIQNCLLKDLKEFTKDTNQYDDITMIVLKKN